MMLGLRDMFTYAECYACSCLQLISQVPDVSSYYPPEYYSYQTHAPGAFGLSDERFRAALAFYFAGYGLTRDSRILDVGSGSGSLLTALAQAGFRKSLGIDPYIDRDFKLNSGPRIEKARISDLDSEWDVILFNHSFEHLRDPLETLVTVSRLLSGSGVCLIRMPMFPSHAWEHYGVDWVQLDAPRHLFIHSAESLSRLAAAAGLIHIETRYDSTSVQFWGSELFRKGIPLTGLGCSPRSLFSEQELSAFERCAKTLNASRRGDQAACYLRKA